MAGDREEDVLGESLRVKDQINKGKGSHAPEHVVTQVAGQRAHRRRHGSDGNATVGCGACAFFALALGGGGQKGRSGSLFIGDRGRVGAGYGVDRRDNGGWYGATVAWEQWCGKTATVAAVTTVVAGVRH